MSVILTNKAKCFGCQALQRGTDPATGRPSFTCQLGFKLSFVQGARAALSPRPEEKCYKPTTKADLKEAKGILDRKAARQEEAATKEETVA